MSPIERLTAALGGSYRIERELGAGGMATVYLAEDLKHNRKVAVKVLRSELAESMGDGRFAREITLAARLQHPNILGLLDSGKADGFLYYVMPYVDGETLRDRLSRGGELPVQDALRFLCEIADALAVAHKAGVVHRDIKPENIMISGRHAMVMDFGVAKAVTESTGASRLTSIGIAMGTPTYMAPEQAMADPHMDGRVDIYAIGVMAYEMLSGQPPFHGMTPQQTLGAHVTTPPTPLGQRRPGISPALEAVVMRCLAKRAADRYQTAEELVTALEPLSTLSVGMTPYGTVPHEPSQAILPTRRSRSSAWLTGLTLVAVAGVGAVLVSRPRAAVISLGNATPISAELPGLKMQPAISPDGEWIAYVTGSTLRGKIYVRRVGGGRPIALTDDTINVEQHPRFSPDGTKILFLSQGGVFVAPAQGGAAKLVAAGPRVVDALWSPQGERIAMIRRDSVLMLDDDNGGGASRLVVRSSNLHDCSWSPDAALLACAKGQHDFQIPSRLFGNRSPSRIVTISLSTGTVTTITDSLGFSLSPAWGEDGQLYFVSDQNHQRDIFALSVGSDGRARGVPQRITSGLDALGLALTPDGRKLLYTKYTSRSNVWSLPTTPGKVWTIAEASPLTTGDQSIESPSVSFDGKWLIFDSDLSGTSNIFRVPVGGGVPEQLTSDSSQNFSPSLSPNGKEIAFHSFRTGTRDIFVASLDGQRLQQVTSSRRSETYPVWSPDGSSLLFKMDPRTSWVVKRRPDGSWDVPVQRSGSMWLDAWSPDSKSLLGVEVDSAMFRVSVVSAESGETRVVHEGPRLDRESRIPPHARWSPDGQVIYVKTVSNDTTSFWQVPTRGGAFQLIARLTDPLRISLRPDFTVDKSRLYFTLDDRHSDLWLVDVKRP